jgi:hypothetical protein
MTILGSIGFGFVWGWLVGSFGRQVRQPLRVVLSTSSATLLLAIDILMLTDIWMVLLFLCTVVGAALIHAIWFHKLVRNFSFP